MSYDMHIWGLDAWDELVRRRLGIVIDPLVLRLGQFFLEGRPASDSQAAARWQVIAEDIGALVTFFDLLVMHDQVPAFNYHDTFDMQLDFGDRLGALLNTSGDKTLVHVDVEHHMYRAAKAAAIDQLSRRLVDGRVVREMTGREILSTLAAVEYEWEPALEALEPQLADADQARVARFLLGQLVFAGYAQQTGAPHVLAPKRSRLVTAVGLGSEAVASAPEEAIYDELRRRFRDAGPGWRNAETPWTPSFPTADAVATSLDSDREELHLLRHMTVEVLPKAVGVVGGTVVGALMAGPPGAAAGGVAGIVGEEALRPIHDRLWGWVLDGLPFRSARKLLARSAKAERELRAQLVPQLHAVWETGRRAA